MKGRAWRLLVGWISVVLTLWAVLPLVNGIVNVGVVIPFIVGVLGMLWGFRRPSSKKPKRWCRVMGICVVALVALVAVLAVLIVSLMTATVLNKPTGGESTVIVLGAGLRGDRPSLMLRRRLDVTAVYLEENPEALCIVTGGQGPDEECTEASAMEAYLLEKGIAPERIIREERATDTHENIEYSLDIIRQQGLSDRVVIATQEFHLYRAVTLARRAGVADVRALSCSSPLHLLLCYWVRECAAICRLWIIGY